MKKGILSTLVLGLAMSAMIAGCGTAPAANTSAPSTADKPATEPAKTSTDAGKFNLVEEGTLSFAMSGLYPPLNFKKDNQLTGFDVEIGTEIAKRIGLKAKPVTNPWETIIQGLKANKYDAIIGSMTATEERSKQVDFTNPYYLSGAQVFVKKDNEAIKSKDDLQGKTIGVIQSSTWKDMADKLSDQVKGYPSDVYALQDLATGRLDAVITDKIVGLSAMNDKGLAIKPIGELLNEDRVSVAVNKGNEDLVKKINEAIQAMIDDGTYEKISMKWFNENIMKK